MHGVLGHDGLAPSALRAQGAQELERYGIEVRPADVTAARAFDGGVEVDGGTARALILATGLTDLVPEAPGFAEIYGTSARRWRAAARTWAGCIDEGVLRPLAERV